MVRMEDDPSVEQFLEELLRDVRLGKVRGLAVAVDYRFADMKHAGETFVAKAEDDRLVHLNMHKNVTELARKCGVMVVEG